MNDREFDDWLKLAIQCWPSLLDWITDAGEGTREQWHVAVADLNVDDAKAAVQSIFKERNHPPFSQLCAEVRTFCQVASAERRRQAEQATTGRGDRNRCRQCRDTGLVHVWDDRQKNTSQLRELANTHWESINPKQWRPEWRLKTCTAACNQCTKGAEKAAQKRSKHTTEFFVAEFDAGKFCLIDTTVGHKEQFGAWVDWQNTRQADARYDVFDEYNAGKIDE